MDRWGQKTLSTVVQLLAWVWANQAPVQAKFFLWGSKSESTLYHVPWSEWTLNLVLQVSKMAGWDYYLSTADISRSAKIFMLVAASPFPTPTPHPSQSPLNSQWLSPAIPVVWYQSRGSSKVIHRLGGGEWVLVVSPRFSFPTEETRVLGFFQWCHILKHLLVVLLVLGNKVRNNLCHYFGDITTHEIFKN